MAGTFNDCFSAGRASSSIKNKNDQQLASMTENAVRQASEAAGLGLGPVQNNSAAPGSSSTSIDSRQTGYYHPGASSSYPNPSAPMGNSAAPLAHHNHSHNHNIRIPQFENATTQSTGHDRTGVGGGRNGNIDAGDMMPVHGGSSSSSSSGLPLPAEHPHPHPHPHHPTAQQPICKQGGIRYPVHMTRAYDTPSSLGPTQVVGLC
jgi:hypothetical protein